MDIQETKIFGIDLGTTYSCIAHVDEYGKAVVIPNMESHLTTPSVVQFQDGNRIVGDEAKNNAMLNPDNVVEMVKRHMGKADWHFHYEDTEYSAEEVSSYILRKLATDAATQIGQEVKDVVITCPAYFGIPQREAVARAGEIAGLTVRSVINEPTAAAINYGLLQEEQDQVVLVYDLGGGTFDITVIRIEGGKITVVATGGDDRLGGRDWDAAIVLYLAEQWKNETGSTDDPTESVETRQDLWLIAEKAKASLTARTETRVKVTHEGQPVGVILSREKFDELTTPLLDRTVTFTRDVMNDARQHNVNHFDYILLVGGSTKMPQVLTRLTQEFNVPCKLFEPDVAVAKGAALFGQKLLIDSLIEEKVETTPGTASDQKQAEEDVARDLGLKVNAIRKFKNIKVRDVASHSFGIIVTRDAGTPSEREGISNLVTVNEPLPAIQKRIYGTLTADQENVELIIMETTERTPFIEKSYYTDEAEISRVVLELPPGLPQNSAIEVTFELSREGRLRVVGRERSSTANIEAYMETKQGISEEEFQQAKSRSNKLVIS
jgi:molecular chaperone DnaK (HSP70)